MSIRVINGNVEINTKPKKSLSLDNSEYWTPKAIYNRAKAAAKQGGREFKFSFEEYDVLMKQKCHYCNDLLNDGKNRGIGLDRIDNSKGYETGNVLRCCGFCNKTKGDRLSVDEMKKVARTLIALRTTNNLI